jgi:hypothetical protein
MTDEDPALTESVFDLMDRALKNPLPAGESRRETPHSKLKKACRKALHDYARQIGQRPVLIPIQNLRAKIPGTTRTYQTGRPGAADDIWLCQGLVVGVEYKAGRDVQSERQKRFQADWELAGGVYIVARDPQQLVEAIRRAFFQRQCQL